MARGKPLFRHSRHSEASFAQTYGPAVTCSGCDIIVDDVFYFDEPVFQDGIVASRNFGTTSGRTLFSSAGNEGNLDSGTAGYFEGDFNDTGSAAFHFPWRNEVRLPSTFCTVAPLNGDIITREGKDTRSTGQILRRTAMI